MITIPNNCNYGPFIIDKGYIKINGTSIAKIDDCKLRLYECISDEDFQLLVETFDLMPYDYYTICINAFNTNRNLKPRLYRCSRPVMIYNDECTLGVVFNDTREYVSLEMHRVSVEISDVIRVIDGQQVFEFPIGGIKLLELITLKCINNTHPMIGTLCRLPIETITVVGRINHEVMLIHDGVQSFISFNKEEDLVVAFLQSLEYRSSMKAAMTVLP